MLHVFYGSNIINFIAKFILVFAVIIDMMETRTV